MGDQDVRATLSTIIRFVRGLATLPGERQLILVSPGFLTVTEEAVAEKSQILDVAAQSNVVISALDARGLYTTILPASEKGSQSPQTINRITRVSAHVYGAQRRHHGRTCGWDRRHFLSQQQ